MSRRSTARPMTSVPAIARASFREAGSRTTSHSRRTPRATASTGSRLRPRSTYATIEPAAWASAASRSASVVFPLEASPRRASAVERGTPPVPRIASSSANPVLTTRSSSNVSWRTTGPTPGNPSSLASPGSGTVASAPTTSPTMLPVPPTGSPKRRGAAAPQRVRRDARAAATSGEKPVIGWLMIEHLFYPSSV